MAILNYTTKISVIRTVAEIEQTLRKLQVTHIGKIYEVGEVIGLTFTIVQNECPLSFLLPCNYTGVLLVLEKDKNIPKNLKTKEQAMRVAWRIIKDWVAAQAAIIEAQMASTAEVFLPYLLVEQGTHTLYNVLKQSNFETKLLKNETL